METENEPLDWGNEEEEQQEALRRASHDYATRQDPRVAEEAEDDTISLGDEEEQGYYYQRDVAQKELYSADDIANDPLERPPSVQRRAGSTGANDQQRSQHDYRDRDHFEGAPQPSNVSTDSPSRQLHSRNQVPPVQPNTTRLKHALPPKPLPANVPYLPPSHPSIVAATSMTEISPRATSNDAKKINGASGKLDLPPTASDLPPGWERRYPRGGGQAYFYNKETYVSTWTHPVSSIPSSSCGQSRHRTRSGSSSQTYMTTSNSDMHHTQTSRANRDRSHGRPEPDIEDAPRAAVADPRDLSYEDRHYRPGGEPAPVGHEIHPVIRSEAVGSQIPRSRYDRSPAVSPTRQRRPRSLTPPSIRVAQDHARTQDFTPPHRSDHMTRERHGYTNAESTLPRDVDMLPPDHWAAPQDPSVDFDRSDRVSRKPPPRGLDDRDLDHPSYKPSGRPPLSRRPDSNRGVPRDREPPRQPDTREHPTGNSGFISASRPYPRERDVGRDYPPYREPISDPGNPPPSDRKERMPRFERSASSNGPPSNIGPPDRELFNSRGRDYDNRPPPPDNRPPPNYEQRRGGDRNFDRSRRDLTPEPMPPARHVDNHQPRPGLERPARYPDPYDRPSPEEAAQISHRRRAPLPPQETTFLSSGPSSGSQARDPPPHVPIQEFVPKSQGWANGDPNLPRRPKYDANNPKALPHERERGRPSTPPGYGQDYRNNGPGPRPQDRGRHEYSQLPPKLDTRMDIDPRDLASTRRPPSPRNVRNPRVRVDDLDDLPEGPRSARSAHNAPERQPYHSTAPSIVPPPNAKYENATPGGFPPPPHRSGYQDDRRFNDQRDSRDGRDNRSGWRDNQSGRDSQPGNGYPDRNPPPRRDFRGRPDDGGRPPAASGANNMPIGTRKHNLPDIPLGPPTLFPNGGPVPPPPAAFGFNPDARPPSSTLIHPGKALELNTRLPNRPAVEQLLPEAPQQTEPASHSNQHSSAFAEAEKSKRRVSRFSPLISKSDVQQEKTTAQLSSPATAPEESNYHPATPPPISRNSSMLSVNEQTSAQHSDRGQKSDGRGTPHSDAQALGDRREDNALSSRFSDDVPASASSDFRARRLSATRSTLSPTDSVPLQRWTDQRGVAASPIMGDPERTADVPPSLSRRMSGEKPPRHRKFSSQYKAPEDNVQTESIVFEAREEYIQVVQESTLKDRLDNANSQRRGSLLDRLSSADNSVAPAADLSDVQPQSLRDRLVPSKRDHNDIIDVNEPGSASYDGDDGGDNKRIKRRSAKGKRGGRR